MVLIKSVKGKSPIFGKNVYLADTATVVGEVEMGDDCSKKINKRINFFIIRNYNNFSE